MMLPVGPHSKPIRKQTKKAIEFQKDTIFNIGFKHNEKKVSNLQDDTASNEEEATS